MENICNKIRSRKTANDVIYTPKPVALLMIEMCDIKLNDIVLDPSMGDGVFFDNLPVYCIKDYCEITMNKDFFNYHDKVDLVIGNPPYSLWNKWIKHTMEITDKFCYIFGCFNFTDKRVKDILDNGFGLTKFHILKIDWWFGHSYICVFEKNKPSIITVSNEIILCEICDSRCKRSRGGNGMNECTKLIIQEK
jgi:hypothetical protein